MNLSLAILDVLSRHASSRLTTEQIRRELEADSATGSGTAFLDQASLTDGVDIFQSALVSHNDAGWQITDKGLSFLRSLDASVATGASATPDSSALKLLDDLAAVDDIVSMEERLKKFEREMKRLHEDENDDRIAGEINERSQDPDGPPQTSDGPDSAIEPNAFREAINGHDGERLDDGGEAPDEAHQGVDAPSFLQKTFRHSLPPAGKKGRLSAVLSRAGEAKRRFLLQGFRPNLEPKRLEAGTKVKAPINGAAFAFFTVLGIAACVAAAVALSQIYSFKSENASLQRELAKVRDHLGKMEQAAIKKDAESSRPTLNVASTAPQRAERTPLALSNDEIQIVREFIRPAPPKSGAELEIKVGDAIDGSTIQFPSALMDKVPKLAGGRFTIRNGAIIILRRDSKAVDLVLPPG